MLLPDLKWMLGFTPAIDVYFHYMYIFILDKSAGHFLVIFRIWFGVISSHTVVLLVVSFVWKTLRFVISRFIHKTLRHTLDLLYYTYLFHTRIAVGRWFHCILDCDMFMFMCISLSLTTFLYTKRKFDTRLFISYILFSRVKLK